MTRKPRRKNFKPPGKCIFCGGADLSKEHFWSDWMAALLPSHPSGEHVEYLSTFTEKTKLLQPINMRTRQGQAWTKKIRVVCRRCNSGWMSECERLAKPILIPLIQGDSSTTLTLEMSLKLAVWITLKVMIAEHNNRGQSVSTLAACEEFRISRRIPDNWRIWIAYCGIGGFETGFYRHAATITRPTENPPIRPNIQSITFGAGNLLVHVLTSPAADLWIYSLDSNSEIIRLYPGSTDIHWPPQRLSYEKAIEVANIFQRTIEQPNIKWKPAPQG